MIEIKLSFSTFGEAAEAMMKLSGVLLPMDAGGANVTAPIAEPEPKAEPARRGRPPKAEAKPTEPAPQSTAAAAGGEPASSSGAAATEEKPAISTGEERVDPNNPDDTAPAAAEAKAATKEDAKLALAKLMRHIGQDDTRKFLEAQGFARLGDVPEDKFQSIIDAADARVAEVEAAKAA